EGEVDGHRRAVGVTGNLPRAAVGFWVPPSRVEPAVAWRRGNRWRPPFSVRNRAPSGVGRATVGCYSGVILRRCAMSRDCVVAFGGLDVNILVPVLLLGDIIMLSCARRKINSG